VAIGVPVDVPALAAAGPPPQSDMSGVERCVREGRFDALR
jgi:hypothetical protein